MTPLVPACLLGFPLVALALFALLPAKRAVIATVLAGWLFLPVAGFRFGGLPDYDKYSAVSYGLLLGIVIFDPATVLRFRPRPCDLPMLVWCLCPVATSLSNDLGLYDGVSTAYGHTVTWGVSYVVGRLYLRDREALHDLAVGIFIAGLIYVPLCLWEIRMSPRLHKRLYGYMTEEHHVTHRLGGYRPMVFLGHGLALGVWMTGASLCGLWLWWTRSLRAILRVPTGALVFVLIGMTLLCRSLGSMALLAAGAGALVCAKWFRTRIPLAALVLVPPLHITLRSSKTWSGDALIEMVSRHVDEKRASSFRGRIEADTVLVERALQRPLFGWGHWFRNRVLDDRGESVQPTDGMWIIAFGHHGVVGLLGVFGLLLLPAVLVICSYPASYWTQTEVAPVVCLALLPCLWATDQLMNGMYNPVFVLAAGAVIGALAVEPRLHSRRWRAIEHRSPRSG